MQDSSGGVFVDSTENPHPVPGDLVQVSGVSDPGEYTPGIRSPHWEIVGSAPLPRPRRVSIRRFKSGAEDGDRVEMPGIVKSANLTGRRLAVELDSDGFDFWAFVTVTNFIAPNSLAGARVRVRGTVASSFAHRRLVGVVLFMPDQSDFIIDQAVTNDVLTTAEQVLSLTGARAAQEIPVCVTGVVTAAQSNWSGKFFVQDWTGGIFVDSTSIPQPAPGDVVEVRGVTSPGGFAPDIESPHWRQLGTAPLPEARPVSMEQFLSGSQDGERVELSGVVTVAQVVKTWIQVELKSGGDRVQAFIPLPPHLHPNSLIGATVRVRGTAAASFNSQLRHLFTVILYVQQDSDFIVDQLPIRAISQMPLTPLDNIAQYRGNNSFDSRIRVRGVVTYQRPGEDIFLHDQTGGLQVQCAADTNIFAPGDMVEAVGFPEVENCLPVLKDSILIRTGKSEKPVVPKKVSFQDFFLGYHHADVVSLQGTLLDRSLRPLPTANSLTNGVGENILTLKTEKYFFTVEAPATGEFEGLAFIPIGSTLEVSGLCVLEAGEQGEIESVRIFPVDASSIHILKQPSWWTPKRLFKAVGILLAVLLVGVTWTLMIHRKNIVLQSSVAEKIKARGELQKAHDLLETRVEERTRELKFEMSARKEAEIQFEAIVSERKRLAQELHDTLLQGFTGIGLKLEAVANTLPPSLDATKRQMQKILEQSDEYLTEARRSVWQLRSPSLDNPGDFSEALKKVSKRALQGTGIPLNFTTRGDAFKLSPDIEDNFLRICEEAVTNAVKHAGPGEVEVTLEYLERELRLQIRDDGCGFDPHNPNGANNGHFGLVGIQERSRRLGGILSVNSEPGQGTEIRVAVHLSA